MNPVDRTAVVVRPRDPFLQWCRATDDEGHESVLITTNKGIAEWPQLFAGDEVLATAVLDRLMHRAHVLSIKGRSYRLRDLEASMKERR